MAIELVIGENGEIYLPEGVIKDLDIKPGDTMYLKIVDNKIVLKKIPDLIELLDDPIGEPETPQKIKEDIREERKKQIKHSLEDLKV